MGDDPIDRTLGWVFVGSLLALLAALLVMLAMGLDGYTIVWLTVVAGSTIGMTALMTMVIRAFDMRANNGSSSS